MAGKSMEYKLVIDKDGSIKGDVICRGDNRCDEFVTVMNSLGKVESVKDKPDTMPNFNDLNQK